MLENRATSIDTLLGGRIRIEQPVQGYRSGLDAVLLAASVPAGANERALELGLGAGAAALCLLARTGAHVSGIECDPRSAALARKNAALNKMEGMLKIIEGKVGDDFNFQPFDHVFTNPPYHDTERHGDGAGPSHMRQEDLEKWINYAFRQLKERGSFTLIHRADMLGIILEVLGALPAGAIRILPIASYANEPAKRVIVTVVKGRKTLLKILSPLVVHKPGGAYDDVCNSILADGATLPLS